MAVAPGVQHIGHEHGVIEGRHFHTMLAEHGPIEFGVLGDLEHAARFKQRPQALKHRFHRQLAGRPRVPAKQIARAIGLVTERNIAALAGGIGERDAHEIGGERV